MDFRAALLEQTRAFGDLIRSGDRDTPVPTCGDWTLEKLFRHVGRGNRWAAQIIIERRNEPLDPRDVPDGRPPDDLDKLSTFSFNEMVLPGKILAGLAVSLLLALIVFLIVV